ncbi:cytochrome P450 [Suillus fuscotomentosus]|uniref:Cytochrome P450 n=1 Tax=Suillus fuscotomentosus TaxID=1912939 RepID=A0AAD4HSQ6_9AGAM|nr:cytochrome P450 [Suillus fuscotomentosus]KAG1907633.1 cytochrome P450 [Suillus fuscotomentosus]
MRHNKIAVRLPAHTAAQSFNVQPELTLGHSQHHDAFALDLLPFTATEKFLPAMVLYPDVQSRARAEIDQVVKLLRWHPHVPLGAGVMVYQWALSRDEDMFPDASRFKPSRHLTVDGKLKVPFFNHMAFGHGRLAARRICPGRWFAEGTLWTAAATIRTVLRVDHAKDSNGDRIEVKLEFTTGLASHPEPFHCSFESVNTARATHLRATMDSK